jgi:diacylglycerol kinase
MSASAVLFAAIISFIIGCIIFLPKIISLFYQ